MRVVFDLPGGLPKKEMFKVLRATARYCSSWSLEKKRSAPEVSKPAPSSLGRVEASGRTPRRSSTVLRYSRRLRRRRVISPPLSLRILRARTIWWERSLRKSVFSRSVSWSFFLGGISPELMALRIFCQRSAVGDVLADMEGEVFEIDLTFLRG